VAYRSRHPATEAVPRAEGHRNRKATQDVHPRLLPLGIDVGLLRQWAQRWTIQGFEGRVPGARQLAKRASVEPVQQRRDGCVEFVQGEELAVAQGGEDPALDHLHANFGLGLVARLTRPRRHYRHAIVLG
tara:strand:- start:80 stop:469 length:390 start_codon:yes stop_codon:yes gene_type:complete